jgi:hypothetical protein
MRGPPPKKIPNHEESDQDEEEIHETHLTKALSHVGGNCGISLGWRTCGGWPMPDVIPG